MLNKPENQSNILKNILWKKGKNEKIRKINGRFLTSRKTVS